MACRFNLQLKIAEKDSMKSYIISHLGQEMGPYTETELKALWEKRQILPVDYLFDEEKQDWFVVGDVFEWAQQLTSTSIPIQKTTPAPITSDEMPPDLTKVERTKTGVFKVEKTNTKMIAKVEAKEDPPPSETIFRRPQNMSYKTEFNSGEAKVDLSDLSKQPGSFILRELPGSPIRFKETFQIEIHPAVATQLNLQAPPTVQAGQTVNVKVEALDEHGHFCPTVDGQIELTIRFENELKKEKVQVLKGLGHYGFYHTRAEKVGFEISISIENLATTPAVYTQIQPGQATHMSVIGKNQFVAGQPIQLQLQAVDQFGNFVQNFSARVEIEADKSNSASTSKSSNKVS